MNKENTPQKYILSSFETDYSFSLETISSEKDKQEILRIEVESKVSLNFWICDILENKVAEQTKYFAESIPECFNLIKAAISKGEASLVTNRENLQLVISIPVFDLKKAISFPLIQQTMAKDQIFEKRLNMMHQELVKNRPKIHSFKFSAVMKSQNIVLSNGDKTATKATTAWKTILGNTPFAPIGRHKFTIRVDKSPTNHVMIGVALEPKDYECAGSYSSSTGWMYYCFNGTKYTSASSSAYGMKVSKPGTKITVIVDMDVQIIGFKIQGFSMGPAFQLDLNNDQKKVLYPAVDLHTDTESVSIVDA